MISNLLFWRLRRRRSPITRILFLTILVLFLLDTAKIAFPTARSTRISSGSSAGLELKKQRVFIASTHWNNEHVLRSHWNDAVVDLVRYFGPENVFVSILESGSWDRSKDVLRELDERLGRLGIKRTIELNETTHEDEISRVPPDGKQGWIWAKHGKKELRRIPYLAGLRNRVMDSMLEVERDSGRKFDKVLWLNDVVFTVRIP
jgi:Cryptococcal mannosyltransferase 1